MVGWHHQLNKDLSELAPGDGEGQGCLACCGPRGCKQLDMTERLTTLCYLGFPGGSVMKNPPASAEMQKTWV